MIESVPASYDVSTKAPALHALVIGVGGYPYLAGGSRYRVGDGAAWEEMTQLTSPPLSAVAVAEWLMNSRQGEWPVSLGSVELLASWPPGDDLPARYTSPPPEPTIENIREAFEKWAERCRQHPDNIALFYFCGHGLQGDGQYLLASDFNRFATAPFAQAFDFDETRLALQQTGPSTQLYIVDACRDSYLERAGGVPGLAVRDLFKTNACTNELTLRLPAFEQAFSERHEVSRLTQALLQCLDGQAATPDEYGSWEVRTDNIRRSINHLLSPEGEYSGLTRTVEATGFGDIPLFRLGGAPPARLTVRCLPPAAAGRTKLACIPQDPPDQPSIDCGTAQEYGPDRHGASIQEWRLELTSGFYTVSAHCDSTTTRRPHGVFPPYSRLSMQVTS
ncbi:caspase family protein [Streptomyces geranii]|uniref:caspase family protein n=1 Tax=Streptomyces geranii TaxID=2058923 RepID=UPI000D02C61E|nr:caspase family protein [Streptomyces geranii]